MCWLTVSFVGHKNKLGGKNASSEQAENMIYFIYGKDTYRSKVKLNELIKKYQSNSTKDGASFEVQKFSAEKMKLDDFKNKLNNVSIFVIKRLMVFEDLSLSKEQKDVTEYLKQKFHANNDANKTNKNANDMLVFYESKVDKKTSLYKFLKSSKGASNIECFEFAEMKPFEIKSWVEKYIKSKGGTIERVALEELLMGNVDLWRMTGELDKLLAFSSQGGQESKITLDSVQKLTSANFDDNIFNLADAVGRGDKVKALELINKQLESGAQAIYLLSMIIRQFRILIQVKEASQVSNNNNMIAKELGIHPFVVQKTVAQTSKYAFEDLQKIYNNLQEIDLKLKTSKISPEVLFTRFLFNVN